MRSIKRQGPKLVFNHAMIYVADLHRSIEFYRDGLGFRLIDIFPDVYARLRSPRGNSTIALHVTEQGQTMNPAAEGLRLYFEVRQLSLFCRRLEKSGIRLDKQPAMMPWRWTHAYLRDPDGHEISLYNAGVARLRKRKGIE